jgi:hypothetical protein
MLAVKLRIRVEAETGASITGLLRNGINHLWGERRYSHQAMDCVVSRPSEVTGGLYGNDLLAYLATADVAVAPDPCNECTGKWKAGDLRKARRSSREETTRSTSESRSRYCWIRSRRVAD